MLRSNLLTAVVVVGFMAVGTAAANGTPARIASTTATAEIYYKCMDGFAFVVSLGSAAHCKKPARLDARALVCPVGFPTFRVDRIDNKDMCAGTNPVTGEVIVEAACNPVDVSQGYTKRIQSGRDVCGKDIPPQVQAPSVPVSR